ncbi:DNA polymerase IV [Paenibacillus sp. FSL A5-0031]|uniref:DNA polymerase IV n=1 Tax=Paenibacillus sp. FSL A5-0031 TaxID=1920420 RepID=UPI00096BFF21|nr:DNA polymerase IV [Paenibacillus sp. FSL A5-0031]OME83101.1 DNA polymerase IV [Paenibacillus sp. FSL A5-0031]
MSRERSILLVDGQSFYASVEKAAHPELKDMPVAVADPDRRGGIILAACPIAKAYGVTTASRVFEALAACKELVIIRPRMQRYITVSLLITEIFESITPLVEPYSIDEQFLDVTGSEGVFGSAEEVARQIQHRVLLSTGVWSRVGIGPTKILAKTATDNFAKRRTDGIYRLDKSNIEKDLWPLPIQQMFMVASKMTKRFTMSGIHTIGDIARIELPDFKRLMRRMMGKQSDIQAEYYWQTARGIDPSPVMPSIRGALKSVSHGKTLRASLYTKKVDIEVVILELCAEVCRRARKIGIQGRVVALGLGETDGLYAHSFGRQMTLPYPTNLTHELRAAILRLFNEHWKGMPVSYITIVLTQLAKDDIQYLDLFTDRAKTYDLERAMDQIKDRFGDSAILRASSLLESGIARERSGQIGGHYK